MNDIMNLVFEFCKIGKDMHNDYVESWLNGKVKDFDMDMMLITEKQSRSTTYKKLINELQNYTEVEQ